MTILLSSCWKTQKQVVINDQWQAQENAKMFTRLTTDDDNVQTPIDQSNNYFCFNKNESKLFYLKSQSNTQTNLFSKSLGSSSLSQQITFVDNKVFDPTVSPDDKYIMFSDRREKAWAIIAKEIGSTNIINVRNTTKNDFSPVFFPNKRMILFSEYGDDKKIWLYQQEWGNESSVNQITTGFSSCFFPDGKRFVFVRQNNATKKYDLLVYDFTSSQEIILKSDPNASFYQPSVSKDGKWIAYTKWQQVGKTPGNYDVFIVDAQGNNTQQITFNPSNDVNPVWSKIQNNKLYILSGRTSDKYNIWSLKAY